MDIHHHGLAVDQTKGGSDMKTKELKAILSIVGDSVGQALMGLGGAVAIITVTDMFGTWWQKRDQKQIAKLREERQHDKATA